MLKAKFLLMLLILSSITLAQQSPLIFYDDFDSPSTIDNPYDPLDNDGHWSLNQKSVGGINQGTSWQDPSYPICDYWHCRKGTVGCKEYDNVSISGGICRIKMSRENTTCAGDNRFYSTGEIVSNRKFKYGYFEARIRINADYPGFWPAFWLFGADDPGGGHASEIDYEWNTKYNDLLQTNILYWNGNPNPLSSYPEKFSLSDPGIYSTCVDQIATANISDWHVYGISWGVNGTVTFTFDGIAFRTVTESEISPDLWASTSIIIGMSAYAGDSPWDNSWQKYCQGMLMNYSPPPTMSDVYMDIDWVRVTPAYQCNQTNFHNMPPYGYHFDYETADVNLCNYQQSWGHSSNGYFGKNVTAGGANCTFTFDQADPPYYTDYSWTPSVIEPGPVDHLDLRATEQIALLQNFVAHPGSEFSAVISTGGYCFNCGFGNKTAANDTVSLNFNHNVVSRYKIYPNPTVGAFTLSGDISQLITIEVVDLTGRSILKQQISDVDQYNIDISSHSAGLYLVRLSKKDGTTEFLRLIKN